jgi:protein arginine kinase
VTVPEWVGGVGTEIVLSSRARLARNLAGIPFRGTASPQDGRHLCERVLLALRGLHPAFSPVADETSEEAPELVEALRLPGNLIDPLDPGPWLSLEDSGRGVLVMDGDHLRIWSRVAGLSLPEAMEEAGSLEALVREVLPPLRDPQFGWITSSPLDAGTGLRASLLLHLPALCAAGWTLGLAESMEALGHPLRGPWGDISEDDAGLFLLTHRRTMGLSESEILEGLEKAASILVREEERASARLVQEWNDELRDVVDRSVAVLGSARLLSRRELSTRVRWLTLGARWGWIPAREARCAMEAHLRTGERSMARAAGAAAEEFGGDLDKWRAQVASSIARAARAGVS